MQLKLWIRAIRAPFFQAVIIPVLLGTAVAWYQTSIFFIWYFLLAVVGAVCVNAGTIKNIDDIFQVWICSRSEPHSYQKAKSI